MTHEHLPEGARDRNRHSIPDRLDIGRLLIRCPDRPGIVSAVSTFLDELGANIVHADQHSTDPIGGTFYMRPEFQLEELASRLADVEDGFSTGRRVVGDGRPVLADEPAEAAGRIRLESGTRAFRAALAAAIGGPGSRDRHGHLEPSRSRARRSGLGRPVSLRARPTGAKAAERRQLRLVEGWANGIVLARYIQILSSDCIQRYRNQIIHIHHSFLPAFVAAKPYGQASARGVKLSG